MSDHTHCSKARLETLCGQFWMLHHISFHDLRHATRAIAP